MSMYFAWLIADFLGVDHWSLAFLFFWPSSCLLTIIKASADARIFQINGKWPGAAAQNLRWWMHVASLPLAPGSKSAPVDAPGDLSAGAGAGCRVACDDPHCDSVNS